MYNGGKIIIGLIVFLVIMTSPAWYNVFAGKASFVPELEIPTKNISGKDQCVLPADEMRAFHMDVLNEWREIVVRKGERTHITPDGREFNRSLSYLPKPLFNTPPYSPPAIAGGGAEESYSAPAIAGGELDESYPPHVITGGESDESEVSGVGHKEAEITRHSCLDCHSNRSSFCDRCHNYMAVDPYCWECHIIPEE